MERIESTSSRLSAQVNLLMLFTQQFCTTPLARHKPANPLPEHLSLPASSDPRSSHLPPQTRDHWKWSVPLHLTFPCRKILNMYKKLYIFFHWFQNVFNRKQQNMHFKSCQTLNLLLFWALKCTGLREHKKQSYRYMLRILSIQKMIQLFASRFLKPQLFAHLLRRLLKDSVFPALCLFF